MNAIDFLWTAVRLPARSAHTAALALALLIGGMSLGALAPTVLGQDDEPPTPQSCAVGAPESGAEPFARTELFFGTAKPDGTAVTAAEWSSFLDREITPRFPDGLTVLTGAGQWQESDGDIIQERSRLVILLYPRDAAAESGAQIEEIRTAYEREFQQESVLRADDSSLPVCVSF